VKGIFSMTSADGGRKSGRPKACLCDAVSKRHFDEVMNGLYPKED
jgi:hypothetical protein